MTSGFPCFIAVGELQIGGGIISRILFDDGADRSGSFFMCNCNIQHIYLLSVNKNSSITNYFKNHKTIIQKWI